LVVYPLLGKIGQSSQKALLLFVPLDAATVRIGVNGTLKVRKWLGLGTFCKWASLLNEPLKPFKELLVCLTHCEALAQMFLEQVIQCLEFTETLLQVPAHLRQLLAQTLLFQEVLLQLSRVYLHLLVT